MLISGQLPLISVVLPSFNHEKYVEEAVRSIWEQSYPNIEIVIVDDASTDATPAILEDLAKKSPLLMKVYHNPVNIGPTASVDRALKLSQGDLIALFASDDRFAPDRFGEQVQSFLQDRELMIVYGNGWAFSGSKLISRLHNIKTKKLLLSHPEQILKYLYTHTSPFFLQTALIRKAFLARAGGYDETSIADDWILNIKIFRELMHSGMKSAFLDKDLVYYRIHEGNLHKDFERQSQLKVEVIERFTPPELKKEAFSNIYWSIGWTILKKQDNFKQGIYYLFESQKNRLNLSRLMKLCSFIITSPFRAIINRKNAKLA